MKREMSPLDLEKVPRERWAGALAMTLLNGFRGGGDAGAVALAEIVAGGRAKFVRVGLRTDRFGLRRKDYERIFDRLVTAYRQMHQPDPQPDVH